ncbi:hypothetical protein DPMN_186211 [Dreissena polymorpha]|uniref:Uncharacterized protein n=1 Tax=Dreissena polymorpha TaxID=45954 RepID=A0A9D4I960_DREPO|nr:hypothetical protein DPMN_186211 [Dreissena polymorpha]
MTYVTKKMIQLIRMHDDGWSKEDGTFIRKQDDVFSKKMIHLKRMHDDGWRKEDGTLKRMQDDVCNKEDDTFDTTVR